MELLLLAGVLILAILVIIFRPRAKGTGPSRTTIWIVRGFLVLNVLGLIGLLLTQSR